jgi:hypothetical protein
MAPGSTPPPPAPQDRGLRVLNLFPGCYDPYPLEASRNAPFCDPGATATGSLGDWSGATPLTLAKRRGYKEMVKILEAAGAH